MIRIVFALALSLGVAAVAPATVRADAVRDPAIAAGVDPGGIAIGLVSSGLDITDAELTKRLARDGEGHPIAWDVIGGDPNPFDAQPGAASGTAIAKALVGAYANARLVAVRTDPANVQSLASGLGFAMRTPAKLVAVPSIAGRDGARVIAQAAVHAPNILFFVPAGEGFDQVPANVVRVAPVEAAGSLPATSVDAWVAAPGSSMFGDLVGGTRGGEASGMLAVARAAGNAACAQHTAQALTAADAKAKFLALARPSRARPGLMVHDPLCWYGGVVHGR